MESTSASLLKRLQNPGDHDAWARFVNLYSPLLLHWAHRLGLQKEDAEDLVQDVFAILVEKLPDFRYKPGLRFRGWLWTITLNRFRTKRRRQPAQALPSDVESLLEQPGEDGAAAIEETEYRQYLIQRALQLLEGEFQESTLEVFWAGMEDHVTAAEIAAQRGITVDAVYAAKYRILRRLREELDGLLD